VVWQPVVVKGQFQLVQYVSVEKQIPVEGGGCVWEETLVSGDSIDVTEAKWKNHGIRIVEFGKFTSYTLQKPQIQKKNKSLYSPLPPTVGTQLQLLS
jgi:hypothetical protein